MKDEAVIKLDDGRYIALWLSDNEVGEDSVGCDSVIGYNLYNSDRDIIDGGEMDYNSEDKNYNSIEDAIDDIIEFATDQTLFGYEYDENLSIEEFEGAIVFKDIPGDN